MALVEIDRPVTWAASVGCDRFARFLGGAGAVAMTAAVFHLEASVAQFVCVIFAGVLLTRTAWPHRPAHPASPASIADLVELEKMIVAIREEIERDVDRRAEALGDRLDGITELVVEIRDQVR